MKEILFGLFGGLALFLYGMQMMSGSLQKVAGARTQRILEVLSDVPIVGVLFGALITGIVQSSSLTTVVVVGFVNAGLMTLRQAIAVIMGANIGTTVTAQILTFDIIEYALPMVAVGFLLFFLDKGKKLKEVGMIIMSLGLIFYGLTLMGDSMAPLGEYEGFRNALIVLSDYKLLGLLAGIVITCIIQSSSAAIGILLALAGQGLIGFEASLPILFGTNIGTCITAVLASIGSRPTAKKTALAHVLFNVIGSIIFMIALPLYTEFILLISPEGPGAVTRQIANAHTLFNVINTLIFLPFINPFTNLINKLIPAEDRRDEISTLYLDWRNAANPSIAIPGATKEVVRMGKLSLENVDTAMDAFMSNSLKKVEEVTEREAVVDYLEREICRYLVESSRSEMTEKQSLAHTSLLHACNDLERVSDHADNIASLATFSMEGDLSYSYQAKEELKVMHRLVHDTMEKAITAYEEHNTELADIVLEQEDQIDIMERRLRNSHIKRLNEGRCSPTSGVVFLDIISNFERVGDHASNLALAVKGEI